MRISTSIITGLSLDAMLQQQGKLSKTQLQISTGTSLLSPADDPYGSARALDIDETVKINDQYQVNAGQAENRLSIEEGSLQAMGTVLQRVRELAVQANNDSQTIESRKFVAAEVEKLYDQLVALGNTTDANGEYVFAGYKGQTRPFVPDALGVVQYFGDDGQRSLKVGPSTSIEAGDPGTDVFRNIRNGNGTFTTLDDPANQGTGIIDPGTVSGTYIPDTYTVKFVPPTVPPNNVNDPVEYYVIDGSVPPNIVAPVGSAGMAEAAFVGGVLPVTGGVQYEEGAEIEGLGAMGVQVSITGDPKADPLSPPYDQFTISPSNNQDIFTTVKNLVAALTGPQSQDDDRAHFHNAMNRVLVDLDQAVGNVLEVRAKVGARLNTIAKQVDTNESFNLQMKKTLSSIKDLDYSQAVTDLNLQMVGLQAAQQAYTKIQGLSLFNYLR